MNIADIKPYTGSVQYKVDVGGGFLQKFLDEQAVEEGIDLDPDFQRGHVWTPQNQTRYLEHLLRGGTSSRTLIWNCTGYDHSISTSADEIGSASGRERVCTYVYISVVAVSLK